MKVKKNDKMWSVFVPHIGHKLITPAVIAEVDFTDNKDVKIKEITDGYACVVSRLLVEEKEWFRFRYEEKSDKIIEAEALCFTEEQAKQVAKMIELNMIDAEIKKRERQIAMWQTEVTRLRALAEKKKNG